MSGKVIVVARVGTEDKMIGYRIMDMFTGGIKDVPIKSMINVLKGNPDLVVNAKLVVPSIIGTNGDLRRYPMVYPGEVYSELNKFIKKPVTIVYKIEDVGFRLADCYGRVINRSKADTIKIAESFGITNGKVVNKDGKKYVSAINGEYTTIKCSSAIKNKAQQSSKQDSMGEVEKSYVYLTKNFSSDARLIAKERFVAKCIDNQNYSSSAIEKIKTFIEDAVNKNGADINLCRYFVGNLGGEFCGVRLKKVKSAIRINCKSDNRYSAEEYSCAEAIPTDQLVDIALDNVKVKNKDGYILKIERAIFGEGGDVKVINAFLILDGKVVESKVKFSGTDYTKDTEHNIRKKVNRNRWQKYMKAMKELGY